MVFWFGTFFSREKDGFEKTDVYLQVLDPYRVLRF